MKEKIQYKSVHITIKLSSKENKALSLAAERSGRKKTQEAKLRLEDHLFRFRSISELNQTVPYKNSQEKIEMEAQDVCTTNI